MSLPDDIPKLRMAAPESAAEIAHRLKHEQRAANREREFGLEQLLATIRTRSFWIEATAAHTVHGLPDLDDAPFLECARTAGVPLVTGNPRHFPKSAAKDVVVITPAQFVTSVRGQPEIL